MTQTPLREQCEMNILIVWVSCKPHFPGSIEGSKWNTWWCWNGMYV